MICHSEQISNIAAALLKAQIDIGGALKKSDNPYYKSKYADLTTVIDSVKEPLNNHGITFLQAVDSDAEGKPYIDTILLHESGQYLSTRTPVFCNKPSDPQAFGIGCTYSKRYALQAILALPTYDDDGEGATTHDEQRKPAAYKAPAKDKPEDKEAVKAARLAIVDDAYFEFTTLHADKMSDGKVFNSEMFANEIKAAYANPKILTAHQKKTFKWDLTSVNKLAESVLPVNCLTDIKVAPDA